MSNPQTATMDVAFIIAKYRSDGRLLVCCLQNQQGAYEPILPVQNLEHMYQRILAQELVVNEPQTAAAGAARPVSSTWPRRASRLQGKGLAAAVGMTQQALPFR